MIDWVMVKSDLSNKVLHKEILSNREGIGNLRKEVLSNRDDIGKLHKEVLSNRDDIGKLHKEVLSNRDDIGKLRNEVLLNRVEISKLIKITDKLQRDYFSMKNMMSKLDERTKFLPKLYDNVDKLVGEILVHRQERAS